MPAEVSIIVPVKNGEKTIKKCLDSLLSIDYPNFDIFVINDGSSDNTPAILREYGSKIRLLETNGTGPSLARNLAAGQAQSDYLAFTDSDCVAGRDWLSELIKGLERYPEAAACGGVQELPEDSAKFEKKVFLFMQKAGFISDYLRKTKGEKIIEVAHNPSFNVIYKRDVFLKEGGFQEGLWPGEDVELDYRLTKKGYKLILNPKAVVYHYKPKNLNSFLKMMLRYGWAQGFLVRKYGIFRKMQLLPIFNVFFLVLVLLCVMSNPTLAFWLVLAIASILAGFCGDFFVFWLFLTGGLFWHLGFIRGLSAKKSLCDNF